MKTLDDAVRWRKKWSPSAKPMVAKQRPSSPIWTCRSGQPSAIPSKSLRPFILCRAASEDLTAESVEIAPNMLVLAGGDSLGACRQQAKDALADGSAFKNYSKWSAPRAGTYPSSRIQGNLIPPAMLALSWLKKAATFPIWIQKNVVWHRLSLVPDGKSRNPPLILSAGIIMQKNRRLRKIR